MMKSKEKVKTFTFFIRRDYCALFYVKHRKINHKNSLQFLDLQIVVVGTVYSCLNFFFILARAHSLHNLK